MKPDARQHAPSAARNRDPIWAVLGPQLPRQGLVLEVASGSGEHTVHFARAAGPQIAFQPSDPDASARASIDAWSSRIGADEHPTGAGAGRCGRRLAHRQRRRRRLHQHDPHLAVDVGHRPRERRTRACCRRAVCCSSTGRTSAAVSTRRRATKPSMRICAGATRTGACATLRPSRTSRHPRALAPPPSRPMPANNLSVFFRRQP